MDIWEKAKSLWIQKEKEFKEFFKYIQSQNVKNVLEIGTWRGGTALMFSTLGGLVITIDKELGNSEWGDIKNIIKITANSQDERTLEWIKEIMKQKNLECFDLLFIDGDHKYESIKQDFKNYSPLVKTGGIIAFHDILPIWGIDLIKGKTPQTLTERYLGNEIIIPDIAEWEKIVFRPSREIQVAHFWGEIKAKYQYKEFVDYTHPYWGGIGIINWEGEFK